MKNAEKLYVIRLNVNYPVTLFESGKINFFNLKDTLYIFYKNDYILYELPPSTDFITNKRIPGTEPYFIFKKNNKNGYLFKSAADSGKGTIYNVDSLLYNKAFALTNIFTSVKDSLSNCIKDEKEGVITEKYFFKKQCIDDCIDTVYFYFSKSMKNCEYSFSKELDSLKKMKLFKIRLLYNQKFSSTYKTNLPEREFLFEIKEVSSSSFINIENIFSKFVNGANDPLQPGFYR